jgi:hypothetical protein
LHLRYLLKQNSVDLLPGDGVKDKSPKTKIIAVSIPSFLLEVLLP